MSFFHSLLSAGGGEVFSAESLAVFTNIETGSGELLTNAEKTAINRFVNKQVERGNWSIIYSYIPLSGLSTSGKARVDWKTGIQATLHFVTGSNPTYSPTTGFTCSGTNYIDTKVNPSTIVSGGPLLLNDAAYSLHIIENTSGANAGMGIIGTSVSGQMFIGVNSAGDSTYKIHRSGTTTFTDTENLGYSDDFYTLNRVGTNSIRFQKDGQNQRVINTSNASLEVPAGRTIHVGSQNNNGTPIPLAAAKYGTFMITRATGYFPDAFFAYWELLQMELGVKVKSPLYPLDLPEPNYSATNAMILNAEGQSNGMFAGSSANPVLTTPPELIAPIVGANVLWRGQPLNEAPAIETLEYNNNNAYSTGLQDNFASGLRAAYEIVQRQDLKLYVWHYCISAMALFEGFAEGFHPDLVQKKFYDSHTRIATNCLPLVTEPVKKIIWHMAIGETDAGSSRTTVQYRTDFFYYLTKKIDFLEGYGFNLANTKLHIIIPKIYRSAPYATRDDIRAAQDQFTIANFESDHPSHAGKIETMVVYNTDKLIHGDLVHSDYHGYMIEGYRLGMYMAKL